MSDGPSHRKGEKTLGQMGLAVSNAERRQMREAAREQRKTRIARNRADKKTKRK